MAPIVVVLRAGAANPSTVILSRIRKIAGITRGPAGAVLPFATADLYRTRTHTWMATQQSDANAAYAFPVYDLAAYQVVVSKYSEYRADVTTQTTDAAALRTADVMQLDGASLNSLAGV